MNSAGKPPQQQQQEQWRSPESTNSAGNSAWNGNGNGNGVQRPSGGHSVADSAEWRRFQEGNNSALQHLIAKQGAA